MVWHGLGLLGQGLVDLYGEHYDKHVYCKFCH